MGALILVALVAVWSGSVQLAAAANLAVTQVIDEDAYGSTDGLSVTASADGQFVYLGGRGVHVFSRNPLDGLLTQIQTIDSHTPGVSGIDRFRAMAISPDQRHLYVASFNDGIVVFARDTITGLLTFVELVQADPSGEPVSPITVAVSPDGGHVYTSRDEAVFAFARSSISGALVHVQTLIDDIGGVNRLDRAEGLTLGHFNPVALVTSSSEEAVSVFLRDPFSGVLTLSSALDDPTHLARPTAVTLSPDDQHVYVASGLGVAHYTFTFSLPFTVGLTFVDEILDPTLKGISGLVVTADGQRVYAVSGGGWVTLLERNVGTGALTIEGTTRIDERGEAITVVGNGNGASVYAVGENEGGVDELSVLRHIGVACPAVASGGCRASTLPVSSQLTILDGSSQVVTWKWNSGAATTLADFGDVVHGTEDMAFCLYGSGGTDLLTTTHIPAGALCLGKPCWRESPTKYGYRSKVTTPDGVNRATFGAGVAGKAKISLKAKGVFVDLPTLPLTTPVVAQLHAATGVCWATTHASPTANDAARFRAKGN